MNERSRRETLSAISAISWNRNANENAASCHESTFRDETSTDDLSTDDRAARANTRARAREEQNARLLARAIVAIDRDVGRLTIVGGNY
jgi:hypothetical protein